MTLATKGTAISRGSRVAYLRLVLLGVAPWPRSIPSSPSTAAAHQRHRPPEDVMPSNGDHCAWRTRGPCHSWLSLRRCSSGMPCRRACVGGAERVVQVLDADKGEEGMGGPSAAVRRRKAEQTEGGIGRTGGECSGSRRRGKVREGSRENNFMGPGLQAWLRGPSLNFDAWHCEFYSARTTLSALL